VGQTLGPDDAFRKILFFPFFLYFFLFFFLFSLILYKLLFFLEHPSFDFFENFRFSGGYYLIEIACMINFTNLQEDWILKFLDNK
jgi:hypothetical protein